MCTGDGICTVSIDSVTEGRAHRGLEKFASTVHSSSSLCGPIQDVLIMEVKEKGQLLVVGENYHMYEEN
jgi:hypothetical protein